jgi:hypothetical protein
MFASINANISDSALYYEYYFTQEGKSIPKSRGDKLGKQT